MPHTYPRTERDLRWIAVNFSAGKIVNALPERLEALVAYHRTVLAAQRAANGEPGADAEFRAAVLAESEAIVRMRAKGVGFPDGEFALSPCTGPDL